MNHNRRTGRPILGTLAIAGLLALIPISDGNAQQKPTSQVQGQTPPPARLAQLDHDSALILIRSTLLALNQANQTGNYTVLRDLASPGFREANNASRLAEIFARERALNLDMSGAAVVEPRFTLIPQIEANGMLRMAGFFQLASVQLNFELLFTLNEQRWQVFGIAVNSGSLSVPAPVASQGSAAVPQTTPNPAPPKGAPKLPVR